MPASPIRAERDELALDTLVSPTGLLLQEITDDHHALVPPRPTAPLADALSTLALDGKRLDDPLAAPVDAVPFVIDDSLLDGPTSVDELLPEADDAELMWEELLDAPSGCAHAAAENRDHPCSLSLNTRCF